MASTRQGPSESYRTENGTIPNARFRDNDLNASGIILAAEHQHGSFDNELAALRDILPNYIAATSITQSFRYDTEPTDCKPIDPQDAISTHLYDIVVVLSNAIRYIRYLENCQQRLLQEKVAIEARVKGQNTLIVRSHL